MCKIYIYYFYLCNSGNERELGQNGRVTIIQTEERNKNDVANQDETAINCVTSRNLLLSESPSHCPES